MDLCGRFLFFPHITDKEIEAKRVVKSFAHGPTIIGDRSGTHRANTEPTCVPPLPSSLRKSLRGLSPLSPTQLHTLLKTVSQGSFPSIIRDETHLPSLVLVRTPCLKAYTRLSRFLQTSLLHAKYLVLYLYFLFLYNPRKAPGVTKKTQRENNVLLCKDR